MKKAKIAVAVGGKRSAVMYQTIQGIYHRAKEANTDVFVFCCYGGNMENNNYNKGEYNIFTLMNLNDYDGFIMASRNIASGVQRDKLVNYLKKSEKPVVSIENDVEGMYFVGIDNYRSLYEMTVHLIDVHHCNKLYYIGGPDFDYENQERYRGYRDACKERGILAKNRRATNYSWSYSDGEQAFWDFKNNGSLDSNAYVCANDDLAIGFINAAKKDGYTIPDDFLVTGFDNSTSANVFSPHIATVDRENKNAGYKACDLLLKAINKESVPHKTILNSSCAFSESCGCAEENTEQGKENSCKTALSILKKDHLSSRLNVMETVLANCSDLKSYTYSLAEYVEMLHSRAFYLMINSSEMQNTLEYNAPYLSSGYDEEMFIALGMQDNKLSQHQNKKISSRELVPLILDGQAHMYLISPIHFQNRCIGYCVSADSLYLVEVDRYFNWLNNIDVTIHIAHEKRVLQILNDKLSTLYMEDASTGLYNRFGYSAKAVNMFQENEEHGESTLIMLMDINNLKKINDNFGHDQGDIAIHMVADAIRACIPTGFIPVRYGGDEFLIIGKCNNKEYADLLEKNINDYLSDYNSSGHKKYEVTVSIGYVIAEASNHNSIDSFVKRADAIMYEAKQKLKEQLADLNNQSIN